MAVRSLLDPFLWREERLLRDRGTSYGSLSKCPIDVKAGAPISYCGQHAGESLGVQLTSSIDNQGFGAISDLPSRA